MINLLPPQQKREISEAKHLKLCFILGALFLFFLISLILVLLALKIYIGGEASAIKIIADSEEKEINLSSVQAVEREIKLINQKLEKLNYFYGSQPNLTELLEKMKGFLPEGTYLNVISLSFAAKEKNKFQVSLRGYSPTREDLFALKKNLEAEPKFSEIYTPPSNWIKSKDIEFSVSFKVGL